MPNYEEIRRQHNELLTRMVPEHLERLGWSRKHIEAERQACLRELIKFAKDKSPWHSKRLEHINAGTVTEADLEEIPPMTKDDLMSNWDEIVTDRRLTLELVEHHLSSHDHHAYLLDDYTTCASSGSSGRRGVFIYDLKGWAIANLSGSRHRIREQRESSDTCGGPWRLAYFGSHHPSHMSYAFRQTFGSQGVDGLLLLGLYDPINEVVPKLNEFQPTHMMGYPTAIQLLAREQKEGRLRISPHNITVAGEPFLREIREAFTEAWGVPVSSFWGMSELGTTAYNTGWEPGLVLNDDLSIIEPVDSQGRPVSSGVRSDKIFVTNLFNHVLPIIRLEVTDQITFLEIGDPHGSGHRTIAEVEGRMDEIFIYSSGKHIVHPHIFRSILGHEPGIVEYQVKQIRDGAEIKIVSTAQVKIPELKRMITDALARIGLQKPTVVIDIVGQIDRAETGKLKRFITLSNR
jgi:phenylacetate-coenzyme A ligase PaaK-like adenylate-forming protein